MDADDKGTPSLHACDLEAAVNVALTRFFAAQQPTDSPQAPSHTGRKKRTKNLKVGSTGYYKQVKKVVLEKLSPEISQELTVCLNCYVISLLTWFFFLIQTFLRRRFCEATGMPGVNSFHEYSPASDTQAADYEDYDGPGPNGFQLYFGDGWRKSRWNRTAMKNMTESFLIQVREAKLEADPSSEIIEACLWGFIQQAQISWRADKPRVTEEGDRVETLEEARARAQEYNKRRAKDVRLTARKSNVSFHLFV